MSGITDWTGLLIPMLSIAIGMAQVTAAGDGQLETVYMETFLICVGKQPHKIVLLQAGGLVVLVYEGAGCSWVHTLL
jgi:hypothetical protein